MEKNHLATQCTPERNGLVVPCGFLVAHPRWQKSSLALGIKNKVQLQFMGKIGVADFLASSHTCIVYVSENEIISGGNNYKRRIAKLCNATGFSQKYVLVDKTPLTEEHFLKIQEFVVLDCDLSVFPVKSSEQTIELLSKMVIQAMKPSYQNPLSSRPEPFTSIDMAIVDVVQKFPQIGSTKANLLLKTYGSLQGIIEASVDKLSKIIGSSSAKQLHAFLT